MPFDICVTRVGLLQVQISILMQIINIAYLGFNIQMFLFIHPACP